ncbi:MAG: DEAD/DEAH box helicase [Planctomycetales bacterium]
MRQNICGEVILLRNALTGRKCIYLVPFKALAEEKFADFVDRFGREEVGAKIIISTADHREHDRRFGDGDYDIAILTYEKLFDLGAHPTMLTVIGAIVVDEIQMVADGGRGAELELLLTRCRQLNAQIQIIGLSAVVSDLNGFDAWLNAKAVVSTHRPVP